MGNPSHHDPSSKSLSSVGIVAEIAEMSNGWAVLNWLITPCQVEWFSSLEDLAKVHATQPHSTIYRWVNKEFDGEPTLSIGNGVSVNSTTDHLYVGYAPNETIVI